MAVGRDTSIKKDNTVIAGVRTKSLSWSGESIDLTSDENNGFRTLEEKSGQEQIDISVEGVMKDETFRALVLGSSSRMLSGITLDFSPLNPGSSGGGKLSGDFRISAFEEGLPYNDAVTFSMSLESSGPWVYAPETDAASA